MREGTVQPRAARIRQLRIERGLTQEELADRMGRSKRTVENLESGQPTFLSSISDVAQALKVPIPDLIESTPIEEQTDSQVDPVARCARIAPELPSLLIGRAHDIDDLVSRLSGKIGPLRESATQRLTVVRGWPGVGKTTIARAVAHDKRLIEAFPDGLLWTSLGPSPSLTMLLSAWAQALEMTDIRTDDAIQLSLRLAGQLRDRRVLLIVDDVWDVAHARPFAIGGARCAMLVTTRLNAVAEALSPTPDDVYRLPVLSDVDGLTLLERLAPRVVAEHRDACRELVHELEGLPLALQVAGRMLRTEKDRGWDVPKLLSELRADAQLILDGRAPEDMRGSANEVSPTVAALLQKSTDALDDVTRKRFARIAPFAPRPAVFELSDLASVWKIDEVAARKTADLLIDRGLLEPDGKGNLQIHQVLVEHAKSLLPKKKR